MSCYAGKFTEGDSSVAMDGVNVLTASDQSHEASGSPDSTGGYVSKGYFDGYEDNQADQPPWGDGDGEVSPEEAMGWAQANHGGPDSGAGATLGADCECVCNTEGWLWDDPEGDVDYWHETGTPTYVGTLDIVQYGIIPTENGFQALLRFADNLPGSLDEGYHEYYANFDSDAPNYDGEGPTHDADMVYIARFLNGTWKMFRFAYNSENGLWENTLTESTVVIDGKTMLMNINTAESGIGFDADFAPTRMASWYQDEEMLDVGDDTETQYGDEGKHCL